MFSHRDERYAAAAPVQAMEPWPRGMAQPPGSAEHGE